MLDPECNPCVGLNPPGEAHLRITGITWVIPWVRSATDVERAHPLLILAPKGPQYFVERMDRWPLQNHVVVTGQVTARPYA